MKQKTSLYRHFDSEGRLLYVGISYNAFYRLKQHESEKAWADDICSVTIEHFYSRYEAEQAEIQAIKTEGPLHNVTHKSNNNGLEQRALRSIDKMKKNNEPMWIVEFTSIDTVRAVMEADHIHDFNGIKGLIGVKLEREIALDAVRCWGTYLVGDTVCGGKTIINGIHTKNGNTYLSIDKRGQLKYWIRAYVDNVTTIICGNDFSIPCVYTAA